MKKNLLIHILLFLIISCSQPERHEGAETSKPNFDMDSIHINVDGLLGAYNLMVQHDKKSFLGLDRMRGTVDSVHVNGGGYI